VPFSEDDSVNHPVSPYAATKKAIEPLARTYNYVYGLKTSGLRFFTVYGPWGRPDMGVFKFPALMIAGNPIDVYNEGKMQRNFTYIDDIVSGTLTTQLGITATKNMLPMQKGDVVRTDADIRKLCALGWSPQTSIDEGVENFIAWYKDYYNIN